MLRSGRDAAKSDDAGGWGRRPALNFDALVVVVVVTLVACSFKATPCDRVKMQVREVERERVC